MASIYARGNVLWCRLKDSEGRWIRKRTRYRVGEERNAARYADSAQAVIDGQRAGGRVGPLTVDAYAQEWLAGRRALFEATRARYEANGTGRVQHRDHATDTGRVSKHVLPHLGAMKLADVRPKHLADWIHKLRTTTTLSPHTIRNVYGLVGAMFRDAAVAGYVDQNPAILTKTQLGEDEGAGEGAGRYTREQFELMIGSESLPEHARVFAALGGLAGLRLGAIAGLRWGDLDTSATPLWRLTTSRTYDGKPTKSGKANAIPVHPVLADLLSRWRHGWGEMFGRAPTASDALLPRAPGRWKEAPGSPHTKKTGGDLMDEILTRLEIPAAPMKAHALRSTFISMALEDGADDRLIERVTHSPGKGRRAFDRYDRADYWPRLCAEVSKLSICPSPRARWAPLSPEPSAIGVAPGRGAAATSPRRGDVECLARRPSLHVCR